MGSPVVFSVRRGDSKRIRTSVSSLAVLKEGHFCELVMETRCSFLNSSVSDWKRRCNSWVSHLGAASFFIPSYLAKRGPRCLVQLQSP